MNVWGPMSGSGLTLTAVGNDGHAVRESTTSHKALRSRDARLLVCLSLDYNGIWTWSKPTAHLVALLRVGGTFVHDTAAGRTERTAA